MEIRELKIPSDPDTFKVQIEVMRKELERKGGIGIDWESLAAWYGNWQLSHLCVNGEKS